MENPYFLKGRRHYMDLKKQRGIPMNQSKRVYIALIGVMIVSLFSGCASIIPGYGKLWPQPMREQRVGIDELEENWEDYVIHYAGLSVGTPAGIMFDPRDDDRALTGEKWIKVEDKETLSELIGWMQTYTEFNPQIWRILGPNNEFFGYLFYPSYRMYADNVVIKVIDDKTMYVYDVESPRLRKMTPSFGM
jgi:hypothetical protein